MKIILLVFILLPSRVNANKSANEKVIYKYKQYEKFDLGDMQIKGNIVAPGDLSVKERRRRVFNRKLYQRQDFNKKIITDIKYLR